MQYKEASQWFVYFIHLLKERKCEVRGVKGERKLNRLGGGSAFLGCSGLFVLPKLSVKLRCVVGEAFIRESDCVVYSFHTFSLTTNVENNEQF